jgi:hypothetical protein
VQAADRPIIPSVGDIISRLRLSRLPADYIIVNKVLRSIQIQLARRREETIICHGHISDTGCGPRRRGGNEFQLVWPVMRINEPDSPSRRKADVLNTVNGLEYGLTCSIWIRNLATAHRCAARVDADYVWINDVGRHFRGAPFGGYVPSGIGKEECIEDLCLLRARRMFTSGCAYWPTLHLAAGPAQRYTHVRYTT